MSLQWEIINVIEIIEVCLTHYNFQSTVTLLISCDYHIPKGVVIWLFPFYKPEAWSSDELKGRSSLQWGLYRGGFWCAMQPHSRYASLSPYAKWERQLQESLTLSSEDTGSNVSTLDGKDERLVGVGWAKKEKAAFGVSYSTECGPKMHDFLPSDTDP